MRVSTSTQEHYLPMWTLSPKAAQALKVKHLKIKTYSILQLIVLKFEIVYFFRKLRILPPVGVMNDTGSLGGLDPSVFSVAT